MSTSWKKLLMEMTEDRGYLKGHRDGYATGCVAGRREGAEIAKRQIAKVLLQENMPPAIVSKATTLAIFPAEWGALF